MDELKASGKPFQIAKQEVWDAWLKVKRLGRVAQPEPVGPEAASFLPVAVPCEEVPAGACGYEAVRLGQLRPAPPVPALEQGQQVQKSGGDFKHRIKPSRSCGQELTARPGTVRA